MIPIFVNRADSGSEDSLFDPDLALGTRLNGSSLGTLSADTSRFGKVRVLPHLRPFESAATRSWSLRRSCGQTHAFRREF